METRMRFAPSPTGFMHIGNLRTAIFSYVICKHNDGKFVVRIEDTDVMRKVEGAEELIYKTLELCHMKVDESPLHPGIYGPYVQSERLNIYQRYAHELVKRGKAYYCFCSEEELNQEREKAYNKKIPFMYDGKCSKLSDEEINTKLDNGDKYVIRQKMPHLGKTSYKDLVYGNIEVENKILEDQILLKSDGYPTYNFANVIDDHLMGINCVVRGNEYLMSTAKYNLLYDALEFERPTYVHLPLVLGEDGQKLSKRNGDASFIDLCDEGYLPIAIVNYLALLGWSPRDNKELFTMEELIDQFDVTRISKAPATYDVLKLQWINAHYIKALNEDELYNLTYPFLESSYDLSNKSNEWVRSLINLYQLELKYGQEIIELTKMFFIDDYTIDDECMKVLEDPDVNNTLKVFQEELSNCEFNPTNIKQCILNVKERLNIKGKMLYMPIRIVTSGLMHGPELEQTIYLLGYDKVINRLKNFLKGV